MLAFTLALLAAAFPPQKALVELHAIVKHGGALISAAFTELTVPATSGDDYVLTLVSGWVIENGKVVDKR